MASARLARRGNLMRDNDLEQITTLAKRLKPHDRLRLIEVLVADLGRDLEPREPAGRRSLYAALADLGVAPSAEEIDRARGEVCL
jgi:hypothetical protein